ncbi:MAG TPA: RNA-binding protein [Candidatus Baltobacteraceae bacterium]|jgi:RNA recognition motif-containing protein|nr:RNA-binding protein [Candidatus Baltobacteraceae bacterium]
MIRLFVAGYPRDAAKADLVTLFRQYGTQEADVTFPRDRRSRRKKGYAYVNVADEKAADAAISAFHGFEIDGKALTVVRAADRPLKRPRRPSGRS